ncbi:MAG TPA: hypothetical protein VK154_20780, partial [Chitinophagales bacterium]|nr:hypothetical protein [Chitinophagales bacterium]
MIRTLPMKTLLLCCLVLLAAHTHAQGWVKKYSPDVMMGITSLYPTADGNYITTGWNVEEGPQRIMKIAANGDPMWVADQDSFAAISISNTTQDGGLVLLYYAFGNERVMLRTDANGQQVWKKLIHPHVQNNSIGNADIDTTDNGGFICALTGYDTATMIYRLYVSRLDANGDTIWRRTYFDTDSSKYIQSLRNSKDGGFVMVVARGSGAQTHYSVVKIDGSGNFLWEYIPAGQKFSTPTIARDGNILLCIGDFSTGTNKITKVDQQGNELWTANYAPLPDSSIWYGSIIERDDNSFALIGNRNTSYIDKFSFCIADSLGNVLLFHKLPTANIGYNTQLLHSGYKTFIKSHDGGYITGGWIQNEVNNYSAFLIKMDSAGVVYPSTLSGNTYYDDNGNCARESNEPFIRPVMLTFSSPTDTFTLVSRDSGYYSVGLDTGNYTAHVAPPSPYWRASACNEPVINLPLGADSSISFGLKPIVYSPYITISSSISRLRACMPSTYTAQYCNTGTAPFTGIIEVEIDTNFHVDSTSVPFVTNAGNKYYFVVAPLDAMQCATLHVYGTLTCDVALTGHTLCIDAHAFQDTVVNVSPLWDQSNLQMAVVYNPQTDTITFTLKNKGNGGMSNPKSLLVIEDNVILMHVPVQLGAGAELLQHVPANGSTWRATIEQTAYNPYSKFATAAIEAAGTNQQGGISLGYYIDYPINGYYGYHYTACGEIRNSFDPNEKVVMPDGVGTDKLVDSTTELEYTLYFQNTGNDTAYLIRLTDTLADYLDPATIVAGAGSHPYIMEILGRNVLQFTFANINLPDSGANQLQSNGFVKFRIKQKPGNTNGTVINNEVNIYFDYNPPVLTNTATVRIGKVLVTDIETLYEEKPVTINAYPNPFTTSTRIAVAGEDFTNLELKVYDLSGRLVRQERSTH